MLGYASTQYFPDLTNQDTTQTKRRLYNAKGPYVTIGFSVLRNDVPFEVSLRQIIIFCAKKLFMFFNNYVFDVYFLNLLGFETVRFMLGDISETSRRETYTL
jgi:hypothetical protein